VENGTSCALGALTNTSAHLLEMKENYHSVDDKIMLDEEERRDEGKVIS
jgi:hypothetical protein